MMRPQPTFGLFRAIVALVVFAAILSVADAAWACPSCKESLSASQANLARGFYYSILFMMSMPFLILGGIGGYFYWQIRKARAALASQPAATAL
jgi:hypothetical protein